jgi:DNA mismatch repair protein MSH2
LINNEKDVIRVYQVVVCLPELKSALSEYTGTHQSLIQSTYIQPLEEYISQLEKLVQLVETTVDLEAANHHEYIIKSDFNPELAVIRGKMKEIQEEIRALAEQVFTSCLC